MMFFEDVVLPKFAEWTVVMPRCSSLGSSFGIES